MRHPRKGQMRPVHSALLALGAAGVLLLGTVVVLGAGFLLKSSLGKTSNSYADSSSSSAPANESSSVVVLRPSSAAESSSKPASSASPSKSNSSASIEPPRALPRDFAAYAEIDRQALAAGPDAEASIPELARYLVRPARYEDEKVRAIYRWITDRIAYDVEAFLARKPGDSRPDSVLKSRKCVCDGYANLFRQLCKEVGIEAVVVGGYAKGVGYTEGSSFKETNHAWNAVKINGQWYLVECTWGAGQTEGDKFRKLFTNRYFLPSPEQLIFSHYPMEARWSLLSATPTLAQFEKQPAVDDALFDYGISGASLRQASQDKAFKGFVKAYLPPEGRRATIREAPLLRYLPAGVPQRFKIECADLGGAALINNGKFHMLSRNGNVFETEFAPQKGMLSIAIKAREGNMFFGIVEYLVE